MQLGEYAVTCYLHAARTSNEAKTRKHLAKLIWLLTYDNEKFQLSECVDQYFKEVAPQLWLPWVPQLLTCLVRQEGKQLLNLLTTVGRVCPQAVYFPIRTLYLTLKVEQRERSKSIEADKAKQGNANNPGNANSNNANNNSGGNSNNSNNNNQNNAAQGSNGQAQSANQLRATPSMWRCSKIMHIQRDVHPTVLSSLEGIVDQLVWFRENWYEEVLRQLKQALTKCYAVAFENRMQVNEATVTPHTLNFVKKLVSTFGVGIENVVSGGVAAQYSTTASESLAKRAQATAQDPVFQRMKIQFTADFDFNTSQNMRLHNLIGKLKKWIKILENKTKLLPKTSLIEEKCRFMSNFCHVTAEVALPGEFLLPRGNHFVKISRFMPRVDVVHKHNTAARRLYILGQNGKVYPYLVVNDACLSDARREERVLQLLRMLNHLLGKQKETARRGLNFTVPKVVAVSPQMRLVEDNPCSLSLLDIYKQKCQARSIEYDTPIAKYYEKLASVQQRGTPSSHQILKDILRDIQQTQVPKTLLKEWAESTYADPTDFWTFRKQFSIQLALCGFIEFVLHLTRLSPDMIYIHQDSGFINAAYYKFDVSDASGELDQTRPVPFRLTPNIAELVTPIGIQGPMCASMIAVARCFTQTAFTALLKPILRDEMITWHKKNHEDHGSASEAPPDMEGEKLVSTVNRAVLAITARLNRELFQSSSFCGIHEPSLEYRSSLSGSFLT